MTFWQFIDKHAEVAGLLTLIALALVALGFRLAWDCIMIYGWPWKRGGDR